MSLSESKNVGQKIINFIKKITPNGASVSINGDTLLFIELVCDGCDKDMGYRCCLSPGHSDYCFSNQKKVNFLRTN